MLAGGGRACAGVDGLTSPRCRVPQNKCGRRRCCASAALGPLQRMHAYSYMLTSLSLSLFVSLHLGALASVLVRMCECMRLYDHVCTYVRVQGHAVRMYVRVRVCGFVCAYVCVCVCACCQAIQWVEEERHLAAGRSLYL